MSNLDAKKVKVDELKQVAEESLSAVVVDYRGTDVPKLTGFRKEAKDKSVFIKIIKNTLAKRAIKDTNFENLDKLFTGPTSVAYSNDPVSTSKAIVDFAKENGNLKILGASMSGKELSLNEIKHLASLPSMETLRAKIVGLLSATQRGIATTLQANQSNLLRVVNNKFKS